MPKNFQPPTSLGDLIRRARERKGITRTKLAQMTAISPNSMVKYEKAGEVGGKYPSLQNAAKISHALEIDPRWVFEMLLRAGDLEFEEKFSFPHFFKAREEGWNFESLIAEVQAMIPALHDIDARMQELEDRTGIQRATTKSGSDQTDPSRSPSTTPLEAAPTASDHPPAMKAKRDDRE